jgi:hypothetical protein
VLGEQAEVDAPSRHARPERKALASPDRHFSLQPAATPRHAARDHVRQPGRLAIGHRPATRLSGRYRGLALPFLRRSVAAFAEYSGHDNTLISCCGHLGLLEEAKEYIAVRNRIGPRLRLGVLRENLSRFAHCDIFVEGLAKAGVPE